MELGGEVEAEAHLPDGPVRGSASEGEGGFELAVGAGEHAGGLGRERGGGHAGGHAGEDVDVDVDAHEVVVVEVPGRVV